MKTLSRPGRRKLLFLAAAVLMIVAGSTAALAIPNQQVFVAFNERILSGNCCFSFDDTVTVTEAAKVVPVVVTWNAEIAAGGPFLAGLSVNGGDCTAYGSRTIEPYWVSGLRRTVSFQWVVTPAAGLVPGTNTFTVCGGPYLNPNVGLILGIRTLAAELGK